MPYCLDGGVDMIKIRLLVVGKVKEKYFHDAIAEYSKRLSAFCKFDIIELKEENFRATDNSSINKTLNVEGERIKAAIQGYPIAFAVEGRHISSEDLAAKIKRLTDGGVGEITFIIGGSYGIEDGVKSICKEKISLSQMTFPHTLARVIVCEQLYRAFTIINGKEYHK